MQARAFGIALAGGLLLAGAALAQAESKDSDPAPGPGYVGDTTGGPDAFGYTFSDQAEPDCDYAFVDISGTGTFVVNGDDIAATQTLGGAGFDFYGTVYTDLRLSTNAYISTLLSDSGGDLSNDCPLPASPSTGGGARIYPLHDDIDCDPATAGSGIYHEYFASCPVPGRFQGGCNIVQWECEHFPGGGGTNTESLQAVLYDSFDLTYQFQACEECGSGSTTGIQDDGPTTGLTYACNSAGTISPGSTAVCWFHPFAVPVELERFEVE